MLTIPGISGIIHRPSQQKPPALPPRRPIIPPEGTLVKRAATDKSKVGAVVTDVKTSLLKKENSVRVEYALQVPYQQSKDVSALTGGIYEYIVLL